MNVPNARELHNQYQSAQPFPHMVLQNVFDEDLLLRASKEFDTQEGWKHHGHKHVCNKRSFSSFNGMGEACTEIVNQLNSDEFVSWLSTVSGTRKLTSDNTLTGAGLHCTSNGGFLDVHRDFNYSKVLKANRKINVIVFLNPNWKHSWHGELELWNDKHVGKRVYPEFGNVVIFDTDGAYHGHPYPLEFPEGEERKSIATYYYQIGKAPKEVHSTIYKGK